MIGKPGNNPTTLKVLGTLSSVADLLTSGGLSPEAVARQGGQFVLAAQTLRSQGVSGETRAYAFFVPGRVEVLGKHTDYAGGRSLIGAVERGFSLVVVPGEDAVLHLTAAASGEAFSFPLNAQAEQPSGSWTMYPGAVVRRVVHNFSDTCRGGHLAFASDLPPASGMSSSSALVVSIFLALSVLNNLPAHSAYRQHIRSVEYLAEYLGCVENGETYRGLIGDRGVGTFGGSEDHTAILCARAGTLQQYAYAPTRWEASVDFPADCVFALASSGVVAEKTGAAQQAYNRAALLAAEVARVWREATGHNDPHLAAAIASPRFLYERMINTLQTSTSSYAAADLVGRFAHFYTEHHEIVPAAVNALAGGDLATFGSLVDQSQRAAETLLCNQVPETIFLAREARELGAVAASAFGAGFGGAVWALVERERAETLLDAWEARYRDAFPAASARAQFFLDRAGPAAFQLGHRIAQSSTS